MNNLGKTVIVVALIAAATVLGVTLLTREDDDERAQLQPVELAPASAEAVATPAAGADPEDVPIPAGERRRIEAAAERIADGGSVAEIDRSDDVGEAYEVEVVTPEGELDIALDGELERVPNLRYDD